MRKELEIIEKIEKYLKNELSVAEREAFLEELRKNPKLQQEVDLQQEVLQGIDRAQLKQKVKKAFKKYILKKNFIKWGLTVVSATIVAAVIWYYFHTKQTHAHSENALYEYNEEGKAEWADADKYLPSQTFTIETNKDTIIETNGGILLSIPANCFLTKENEIVHGTIELEIKEALEPASIIKAGLVTKANDRLLETAGMFYVNARKDGNSLSINPKNKIYVEVPTDEKRGDMKLFDGKRLSDGTINWENPQKLNNFLSPVDIHSLDFYPPHYLDSLKKWGYDYKNKKFTDSLYFSFASLFMFNYETADSSADTEIKTRVDDQGRHGEGHSEHDHYEHEHHNRGINPALVQAMWSDRFQNTLFATKEFEERMPLIHRSCAYRLFNLYVEASDTSLYLIDSVAATMVSGELREEFLKLAKRKDGEVNISSAALKKLSEYYKIKTKALTLAASKTYQQYWEKQSNLEQKASSKKAQHQNEDVNRERQNLEEEYDINLTEACRQLGIKKPVNTLSKTYGVSINTMGWKNLDAYVMESTINRTTLDYTAENGKKAVIKYLPVSIRINDYKDFDRIYVYLLPDKLNSFMRLKQNDDKFEETLNELIAYDMICLGYKGEETYFVSIENLKPQDYEGITLSPIAKDELDAKLNSLKKKGRTNDMKKELDYWQSEIQETKRKIAVEDKMRF